MAELEPIIAQVSDEDRRYIVTEIGRLKDLPLADRLLFVNRIPGVPKEQAEALAEQVADFGIDMIEGLVAKLDPDIVKHLAATRLNGVAHPPGV